MATAGHQGRQMSGWFSDPSPELGSPLTFPLQTLGVRMTHPTSVFTTCPEPSTQHERCHLLRVSSSTHVVGQEMEAHTLKTLWAQDYGSEQKLGCGRTPPWFFGPTSLRPRHLGSQLHRLAQAYTPLVGCCPSLRHSRWSPVLAPGWAGPGPSQRL